MDKQIECDTELSELIGEIQKITGLNDPVEAIREVF